MPYETARSTYIADNFAGNIKYRFSCGICESYQFGITTAGIVFCLTCKRTQHELLAGDTAEDRLQSSGNDADDHDDVHIRMEAERSNPTTTYSIINTKYNDDGSAYRHQLAGELDTFITGYVAGYASKYGDSPSPYEIRIATRYYLTGELTSDRD